MTHTVIYKSGINNTESLIKSHKILAIRFILDTIALLLQTAQTTFDGYSYCEPSSVYANTGKRRK